MAITVKDKNFPYEDVSVIDIPFPEEKYKSILKICGLEDIKEEEFGPHQLSQVFVNSVYYFLKGEFSQDDLSQIANHLWSSIKGSGGDKFDSVREALYAAGELAFYIRRIYDPQRKHNYHSYEAFMEEVMEYYAEHKQQVVKIKKSKHEDNLEKTKYWGPSRNVFLSVLYYNKYKRRALDLGCGSLRDSKFLSNSGFIVDAIDTNPRVREYAKEFILRPKNAFNITIGDYIKIDWGEKKYDMVVAQNTLSFNKKSDSKKVFEKVYKTLKKGGFFTGNLYGLNDSAVGRKGMSFYTKKQVEALLDKFKIIEITDTEGDDEDNGKIFHWHTIEFIAQKH